MKPLGVVALAISVSVAACGGPHSALLPKTDSRQLQNTPEALPGNTPEALPGNTPEALPGATLACNMTFEKDRANCTVALNIRIPPVRNASTPSNLLPGLHPQDLRAAYALPWQNMGGAVAIVDAYDDPTAEVDLAIYRAAYGLPPCTTSNGCFRKLNERGQAAAYPFANIGWSEEISLDLDVVSAICPHCSIRLIEANSPSFDDLGTAVDRAASLHPLAISNSYYGPEWSGEIAYDVHYNHPGIAVTVSAGDQASSFYPAASPYVTSVGGTSLSPRSGAFSESAWAYTGQGCSLYESKPSWQTQSVCRSTRSTVDVAAIADPQTGVSVYDSTAGGWVVAGGTSVGAPIVAAAYALSRDPRGPAYSYAHRSAFHDIAPLGYDRPTGLGSPNGVSGL